MSSKYYLVWGSGDAGEDGIYLAGGHWYPEPPDIDDAPPALADYEVIADTVPGIAVASHQERLARLPDCDADGAEAPCKVGEIIIEAGDVAPVEVWRRD